MSTNGNPRPAFSTAAQCKSWLETSTLTNPIHSQAQFLHQLNLLNRVDLPAAERWGILEELRKPVLLAQDGSAKRFAAKALPLVPPEKAAFDTSQALWQALAGGYLRCLESLPGDGAGAKTQAAMCLERSLATLVDAQTDTYTAGFEPTPEHWRTLHRLFATAEKLGVVDLDVEDRPYQGKAAASVRGAYADAILRHMASPHELPLRHLVWVCRWSRRWASRVTISAAPVADTSRATPLCVDLAEPRAATYLPLSGPGVRWLDTTQLRQSLKKRISMLQQGSQPMELQLGDDCPQPTCGRLLRQAYQRWCKGGEARGQDRHAVEDKCELISGIPAIHYYLSGRKPFTQPGQASDDSIRRERDEIATFGRIRPRQVENFSAQQGYQVEDWQVVEEWTMVDESAQGLHAVHDLSRSCARVSQGQLVAVRAGSVSQMLLLGSARWAMVTADNLLHLGIQVVPGKPEAVAVRSTGLAAIKEGYRQGFLLPAVAGLGTAANIILPSGWYKRDRVVEVLAERSVQVRLVELLDRGSDFDRASYEMVA